MRDRHPHRFPVSALAALLALVAGLLAPLPADASQQSLKDAENRRFRAMAQNDLETLERLLDRDLVYTHTNGRVDGKATFLATLESGAVRYRKIEVREMSPVFWAGEAGMVTGRVVLHVEAGERRLTLPVRYTAVYRLSEDRVWRLLGWQSTVIPEAAPAAPATEEENPADEATAEDGSPEGDDGEEEDGVDDAEEGNEGAAPGQPGERYVEGGERG